MSLTREHLAQEIIDAGRFLYGRGGSPAQTPSAETLLRTHSVNASVSTPEARA